MDIRLLGTGAGRREGRRRRPAAAALPLRGNAKLAPEHAGQLLGEWQAGVLRLARRWPECRGLSTEQLEDIYQETVEALLPHPFKGEEHLRHALAKGIRNRALNLSRDERRREEIIEGSAGLSLHIQAGEEQPTPERAALNHEDRAIVTEFLAELSTAERRVFWLLAEGMKYRSVAAALGIDINEARNATRACERKRERFQLLYDTGRLCGFRVSTIQTLQNGEATSEELAVRAFAHLERCDHCRAEHRTNARRLQRTFREQAAALLPPVLLGRLGWIERLGARIRTLQHRLTPDGLPAGPGEARERAAALIAGSGAATKIAAVATAVVIAGGAVATRVLEHSPAHHDHATPTQGVTPSLTPAPAALLEAPSAPGLPSNARRTPRTAGHPRPAGPGRVLPGAPRAKNSTAVGQHEPGGFAYLGVPTQTAGPPAGRSGPAPSRSTHGSPFSP
jgi:RNA polymerase sigma factor (sigma-70 family)